MTNRTAQLAPRRPRTVAYEGFRYLLTADAIYGQLGARRNVRSSGPYTDRVVDRAYAAEIRAAAGGAR